MLNDAETELVAREVKARTGAMLTRDMGAAIALRLQPLARRQGFATVPELIGAARARVDGALWASVADQLAQSDTRFFRDRTLFKRLRTDIFPAALARRGHERLRLWSAGCSTGQEPYSIAMVIEEMRAEGLNPAIEIIATDFSDRLLDKARTGLYTQFEIQRGLPIRKLIEFFEKAGDLWRISDRLRASVRFETFNLMKHPGQLGQFDIVMLTHVLTSFDEETRAATLMRIAETLAPDGVIILGEGETLPAGCDGLAVSDGVIRKRTQTRVAA